MQTMLKKPSLGVSWGQHTERSPRRWGHPSKAQGLYLRGHRGKGASERWSAWPSLSYVLYTSLQLDFNKEILLIQGTE